MTWTSTYFASVIPRRQASGASATAATSGPDCVQVGLFTLVVTPDGLPLAYESYGGQHLGQDDAARLHVRRGSKLNMRKARRTWVMDRGIPTDAVLEEMRTSETPIQSASRGGYAARAARATGAGFSDQAVD